jgi:uncharacterized protein (DUF3084 family)
MVASRNGQVYERPTKNQLQFSRSQLPVVRSQGQLRVQGTKDVVLAWKKRLSKARIRTELEISRSGPRIGKTNQKVKIRRKRKDTCSSGRFGGSVGVTEVILAVRGEGAIGSVRRLEALADLVSRLEVLTLLSRGSGHVLILLPRTLLVLNPLLLPRTRSRTLKQT